MKTRSGFVSNSSSSSFVIIGDGPIIQELDRWAQGTTVLVLGDQIGATEFGWGPERLTDMGSRLNLAWVLSEHDEYRRERLIGVIQNQFPGIEEIQFQADYAYVDHQSFDSMADDVFASDHSLWNFLFRQGSEIQLDNDNH